MCTGFTMCCLEPILHCPHGSGCHATWFAVDVVTYFSGWPESNFNSLVKSQLIERNKTIFENLLVGEYTKYGSIRNILIRNEYSKFEKPVLAFWNIRNILTKSVLNHFLKMNM